MLLTITVRNVKIAEIVISKVLRCWLWTCTGMHPQSHCTHGFCALPPSWLSNWTLWEDCFPPFLLGCPRCVLMVPLHESPHPPCNLGMWCVALCFSLIGRSVRKAPLHLRLLLRIHPALKPTVLKLGSLRARQDLNPPRARTQLLKHEASTPSHNQDS